MGRVVDLKAYVPALAGVLPAHAGTRRDLRHDLLEKDVLLHLLLARVVNDDRVRGQLVFKGGTCLIKCYLGYPRFSVDLDFTWGDQALWGVLPPNRVRGPSRPARHATIAAIKDAAAAIGLPEPVATWGHFSERLTMEIRHTGLRGTKELIKFQVNFVEPLIHGPRELDARSLLAGETPGELVLLDEDLTRAYATPVRCLGYDAREVVAEKGRAILTRDAAKVRDVLDLFIIEKTLGVRLRDHLDDVTTKVTFSASREERYAKNLIERAERLAAIEDEDVAGLLLKPIDERAFSAYRESALAILDEHAATVAATLESGAPP